MFDSFQTKESKFSGIHGLLWDDGSGWSEVLVKLLVGAGCAVALLVVSWFAITGLTLPVRQASSILDAQGYTDLRFTGKRVFGCGYGESESLGFQATTMAGKPVTGVVCSSAFADTMTVRLDPPGFP